RSSTPRPSTTHTYPLSLHDALPIYNVLRYWEKIGPGLNTFSAVPETTGLLQASLGAILAVVVAFAYRRSRFGRLLSATREDAAADRKSTRLNSSHQIISYAVFCLKK